MRVPASLGAVRTLSCVASVNPWLELPSRGSFTLPADEPYVDAFNAALDQSNTKHRIIKEWPPGPFAGCFDAPVVVLLANPGWSETGLAEQCAPGALKPILEAITTPGGTPVWPLTECFADTEPGKWWRARTRDLAVEVGGFGALACRLLMVELHGYHSREWLTPRIAFPSQRYGFELCEPRWTAALSLWWRAVCAIGTHPSRALWSMRTRSGWPRREVAI